MKYSTEASDYTRLSVMPEGRLRILAQQAIKAVPLPGDVAELGVYQGGSTLLLASIFRTKTLHAFESFSGLADLSPSYDRLRQSEGKRGHLPNDFAITDPREIAAIEARLSEVGVVLHRGMFTELKSAVASNRFCFAHFDADTFSAAEEFLAFFYPRLVPNGRIVLDDFEWEATPGVARAVHKLCNQSGVQLERAGPFQAAIVKERN